MYCRLISVREKASEDTVTCNSAIYCSYPQSRRSCRRTKTVPPGSWSPKTASNRPPPWACKPLCSHNEHRLALLLGLNDRMEQKCCHAGSKSLKKSDSFCFCSWGSSAPPCFPARESAWRGGAEKEKFWDCMEKKRQVSPVSPAFWPFLSRYKVYK